MKSQKLPNIEALRCLAMMMVVVLHYLDKGKLLGDLSQPNMGNVGIAAWVLESLCIVAVNVYMLISGYFLCMSHFKVTRLLKLYLQVWTYSVGVGVLACVTGILPETERSTNYYLTLLLPVAKGHYWFMTAYVFLYVLLPFLGMAAKNMTKKQFQVALLVLLSVFCFSKSIFPVILDEVDHHGYDCVWYICVFMIAAYFRRFGAGILEKGKRSLVCYLLGVALIFGGTMGIRMFYLKTGRLHDVLEMFKDYNHVFVLLASIGLFLTFLHSRHPKTDSMIGRFICKIAPFSLGVYLLHENKGVRFAWAKWLWADDVQNIGMLIGFTLLAVVIVFTTGIVVEMIRSAIMSLLNKAFLKCGVYAKLIACLERMDGYFAENTAVKNVSLKNK